MKRLTFLLALAASPVQAVEWCRVAQDVYSVALPSFAFRVVPEGGKIVHSKFDGLSCDVSQVTEAYADGANTHTVMVESFLDGLTGLDGVPPPTDGGETYTTSGGLEAAVTVITAPRGRIVVSTTVFPKGQVISAICSGPEARVDMAKVVVTSVDLATAGEPEACGQ